MKNSIIQVKDLHKSYFSGKVESHVLRGVNLEIKEGEFVSVIGPSGTGKSTLLYQISLLDKASAGTINVLEKDIEKLSDFDSAHFRLNNFGYVFQDYGLVPDLTALENVLVPLLMKGQNKKLAIKHATQALEDLGLHKQINNLPGQLSGGEQQRVGVARAIAGKPKIIFADEPTASLDTVRSQEVIDIFLKLHKEGQTIVMVTHEEEFANQTDRIVEMLDGRVVKDRYL